MTATKWLTGRLVTPVLAAAWLGILAFLFTPHALASCCSRAFLARSKRLARPEEGAAPRMHTAERNNPPPKMDLDLCHNL